MSSDFGALIRAGRLRAGLTQDALAHTIGVGRMKVSYWETGRCAPRPKTIQLLLPRLAALLSVPLDALEEAAWNAWRSVKAEAVAVTAAQHALRFEPPLCFCGRKAVAHHYCSAHLHRWKKTGRPGSVEIQRVRVEPELEVEIRQRYQGPQHGERPRTGPTLVELAQEFGLSPSTVGRIVKGPTLGRRVERQQQEGLT